MFLAECPVMTAAIDFVSQDSFRIMSESAPEFFYDMNKLFGITFVVCIKTHTINKCVTIDDTHGNLYAKLCWGF